MQLAIVETTAEGRKRLAETVTTWIRSSGGEYLPNCSIRSFRPDELRFQAGIDVVFFGPDMIAADAARLRQLCKAIPRVSFIAVTDDRSAALGIVEQLARIGVDDLIRINDSAETATRRLLLLQRRTESLPLGELWLVQSGKGGSGVTSIATALADGFHRTGKKVCLVDLDVESQDLTRFLLIKPAVNESLDLVLHGQRAPVKEAVLECIRPIWSDVEGFSLVPPPSSDVFASADDHGAIRAFQQIVETIRSVFDLVIVDGAQPSHTLRKLFAGTTHRLIEVVTNDPAALPAAALRLSRGRGMVSENCQVTVVVNSIDQSGLHARDVEAGLGTVRGLPESVGFIANRYSRSGRAWPASGGTFWSSSSTVQSDFRHLVSADEGRVPAVWTGLLNALLSQIRSGISRRREAFQNAAARIPLPSAADRYLPSPESPTSSLISKPKLSEVPGSV
jgi:MinD-like ATPase involved in chromosome partitioning or flagellar assembly